MASQTQRRRTTAPIAAVLLVLQALAGGLVPLAHAGERETAPSAIEAHHNANCVVIHDALRCALCQYAGSLSAPPAASAVSLHASIPAQPARLTATLGTGSPTYVASQPRAPPIQLS